MEEEEEMAERNFNSYEELEPSAAVNRLCEKHIAS